jgi:hypothetical protein
MVASACVIAPLEYEGKLCTDAFCGDGLRCIDGVCRTVESSLYVTDFRAEWATPNSISWTWTLVGDTSSFVSYELVLESDVADASGARTWTSQDNPELASWQLLRTGGVDRVKGTITDGLDPSTVYRARIRVRDKGGRQYTSSPAQASTDTPRTRRGIVFPRTPIATLPEAPCFRVEGDGGVDGGPSLHYVPALDPEYVDASADAPYEGQNLRVEGLDIPVDGTLTPKLFQTAYLEFSIRGLGRPASSWGEIWLRTRPGSPSDCGGDCFWRYKARWVYHPDETNPRYRKVQIPLSALAHLDDTQKLTLQDLALRLDEFNVQPHFEDPPTDQVWLDAIAIWW